MAIKRCKWHHKGFLIDTIRIWTHIFGKWVYIFTCASMEHVPKRKWKEKYRIKFYNYIIGIFLVGSHLHNYFCIYQAAKSNRHHHVVDAGFLVLLIFFILLHFHWASVPTYIFRQWIETLLPLFRSCFSFEFLVWLLKLNNHSFFSLSLSVLTLAHWVCGKIYVRIAAHFSHPFEIDFATDSLSVCVIIPSAGVITCISWI